MYKQENMTSYITEEKLSGLMRCNSFVPHTPGKQQQQKKMQFHISEQKNENTFTTLNKAKLIKTLKEDLLELKLGANTTMKIYSPEK